MAQLTVTRVGPAEVAALERLLDSDPIDNVYLRSELRLLGTGAPWWCVSDGSELRGVVLAGALTVPYLPDPTDAPRLAEAIRGTTPPHLMVGPRAAVLALHACLEPRRPAREIHDPQPVMVIDRRRLRVLPPAPIRASTRRDVDALAVAAAMMHREELSADTAPPDATAWRARMTQLVDRGWSWVWTEANQVVFKAELSAWTEDVVQIQGVFTGPSRRGRGVATAGMTALCALLLEKVPLVTLYVNGYNQAALRVYGRVGFEQQGEFATVMY
ncbi:MAG TPA: GNAT family N-acetyltransferase [Candidatus Deferrimicrobium sp.]|nr:GNAT family N-acetyltransferase [Candidatus Deferrimicrobium sp.]